MIIELDNFVSDTTLNSIKTAIEPCVLTKGEPNKYHRQGVSLWLPGIKELTETYLALSMIFRDVKREIRPKYKPSYSAGGDTGYEFHRYNAGEVCKEHVDSEIVAGESHLRYASAILHLNTVDGGDLVFPQQDIKVKTQAGKVVVFPPYGMYSHYTTPANVARDVIVTWFVYDGLSVVKNGINITSNQGL